MPSSIRSHWPRSLPELTAHPATEALFDQAACGLLLTRVDGSIERANATFCGWLGLDPATIAQQTKFQELLTIGSRVFHQTHWFPLMKLQGGVAEVKLDFRHRDGHKVPMLVNATVVTSANGQTVHSIAAFRTTDRDLYEQELVRTKAEALELLRQRMVLQQDADERSHFAEQLIGIVSHDLRNPLTAIRLGAQMLVIDDEDPRRLRLSMRINQSVDRAMSLVEDLLDFTLTKTGRTLVLDAAPIDLHAVTAIAIEELRMVFPDVTITHRQQGPGMVEGDAERLTRVLGNLVANAARYGDTAHPVVVTSRVEAGVAGFHVLNQGTPIDPVVMPTLFQAMTRGDVRHGGGVGLGLYIVQQIALAHGGRAIAASDAVNGTCMGIEFPARVVADAGDQDASGPQAPFPRTTV